MAGIPLGFDSISLLLAVTAIILLVTSELISPYYGRTRMNIDKKKMRNSAFTFTILFLVTVVVKIAGIVV